MIGDEVCRENTQDAISLPKPTRVSLFKQRCAMRWCFLLASIAVISDFLNAQKVRAQTSATSKISLTIAPRVQSYNTAKAIEVGTISQAKGSVCLFGINADQFAVSALPHRLLRNVKVKLKNALHPAKRIRLRRLEPCNQENRSGGNIEISFDNNGGDIARKVVQPVYMRIEPM